MLPFVKHTLNLLPRTIGQTRRAWMHLARPVTLPSSPADWQKLVSGAGPLEGPFDWALCLGSMRAREGGKRSELGCVVDAWRLQAYDEARSALAGFACELLEHAESELGFDVMTELPFGFESGPRFTLLELAGRPAADHFWARHQASSYRSLPAEATWAERTLSVQPSVAGNRVLLTTLVFDRPELASQCVHLLRAQGATWVGMLALAKDVN